MESSESSFRNKYAYSEFMYVLAGCIAEKLGVDQDYGTLLRQNIFEPLEMNNSTTFGTLLNESDECVIHFREGGNKWNGPSQMNILQCGDDSIAEVSESVGLSMMYFLNHTNQELQEIDLNYLRSDFVLNCLRSVLIKTF